MKNFTHINTKVGIKHIFETYFSSLVIFANTFLIDIAECEDVVQNTFLQLWQSQKKFPNQIALKTYLYTVVKNKCLNNIRHNKVKENYQSETKNIQKNTVFMEEGFLVQESAKVLHKAISTLSPRKKEIIDLALKGVTNNTIGERLSIKLETVKSLKSKAYKALRNYLEQNLEENIF